MLSQPTFRLLTVFLGGLLSSGICRAVNTPRNLRISTNAVYSMYPLPRFEVRLLTRQPHDAEYSLDSIGTTLQQETESYLKDYMNGSLLEGDYAWEFLYSVDLFISLRLPPQDEAVTESQELELHAELHGTVAVQDPKDTVSRPTNEEASVIFETLVDEALNFGQGDIYKERLMGHSDPLLRNLMSVEVLSRTPSQGRSQEPSNANSSRPSSSSSWSGAEIAMLSVMLIFLLGAAVFFFVYVRPDLARKRKHYVEYNDNDRLNQHRSSAQGSGGHSIFNMVASSLMSGSDPNYNGTNGNPDIVPVAVEQRQGLIVRRYVRTIGESFEFLYGASFLHGDRELVEMNSSRRRMSTRRFRHRPQTSNVRPMLSIPEEPHLPQQPHVNWTPRTLNEGRPLGDNEASSPRDRIGHWMYQRAQHFDGIGTPDRVIHVDGLTTHDQRFVYRDSPPHIGTACLMRTRIKEGSVLMLDESDLNDSVDVVDVENMLVEQSGELSMADVSFQSNPVQDVETFVDKLEGLMTVRHQQYQEKVRIDHDREAHLRSQEGLHHDTTNISMAASTLVSMTGSNTPIHLGPTERPMAPTASADPLLGTPAAAMVLQRLRAATTTPEPPQTSQCMSGKAPPSMATTPATTRILSELGPVARTPIVSPNATVSAAQKWQVSEASHSSSQALQVTKTPRDAGVLSRLGAVTGTLVLSPQGHGRTAPEVMLSPVPDEATRTRVLVSPTTPVATSPLPPTRLISPMELTEIDQGRSMPVPIVKGIETLFPTLMPTVSMDDDGATHDGHSDVVSR